LDRAGRAHERGYKGRQPVNTSAFFTEIDMFWKHLAPNGSSRRLCGAVYPVAATDHSRARYIPKDISVVAIGVRLANALRRTQIHSL
jgi:hypothetical protein